MEETCNCSLRGARRLFPTIQSFVKRYGRPFFATQRWVAAHFGACIRSVKYWYAELIAAGSILQRRRSQRSAEIIILRSPFAPHIAPHIAPRYKVDSGVSPTGRKPPVSETGTERTDGRRRVWEPEQYSTAEMEDWLRLPIERRREVA